MNNREKQKQETRELILKSTEELLLVNGFIKVSTKDISGKSGVSQGSIFLHFKTKDNLLNTIITSNIQNLYEELTEVCIPKQESELFLKNLLDVISRHENILSRVYKDYSYLPENLHKSIDQIETTLKNLMFENLRNNPKKKISIVDTFISIDAFFSQIQKNMLDKDVYTEFNSITRQRRGKLVKLYRTLFE